MKHLLLWALITSLCTCLSKAKDQISSLDWDITRATVEYISNEREKQAEVRINQLQEGGDASDPFFRAPADLHLQIQEIRNQVYPPLCIEIENKPLPLSYVLELYNAKNPILHASLFKPWPEVSDQEYRTFQFHLGMGHINPPVLLSISNINYIDDTNIAAYVSLHRSPNNSEVFLYKLVKLDDRWKVVSVEHKSIS